jgi:8-oxo-dGTP pyrophosphatase MutT (NUDIX family)
MQLKGNRMTDEPVQMNSMKNNPSQNSDSKPNNHFIQAAGGLVWRQGPSGKELAIIHRRRYQDWSLPKGKLKNGESWRQAALREVREETGCEVMLGDFAGQLDYFVGDTPKRVLFWHMQAVTECQFYPNDEVDAVEWLSPARALERLNYAGERAMLMRWLKDSDGS